jgi:hypothetical protein
MHDPVSLNELEEALEYRFKSKPLLIGGAAMEYYGLRKRGVDIDLVVMDEDYQALASMHPAFKRDIYGDLGVCKDGYEVWRTIMMFGYDHLSEDAEKRNGLLVVSLEKLLLLKALGMNEEKYFKDLRLIVKKIIDNQYE